MKRRVFFVLAFFWGCRGAPFLIQNFEGYYKPKIQTVVLMPFDISFANSPAERNRQMLEENLTLWIARGDTGRAFVFPGGVRLGFQKSGLSDSVLLGLAADTLGKAFSAQAILYTKIVRLYESEGANQTTRQIRASKYARRGTELVVEFRLLEAVSGKLLWKERVGRWAEDAVAAVAQAGRAASERWPLKNSLSAGKGGGWEDEAKLH
jgi:hypothetical protein